MTSGQTMTMAKLALFPVTSTHPSLNVTYRRPGYSIEYSPHLVRTRSDYYNSKAQITDGRMSTAAEELAIQLGLEKAGADPRKADVFDDLLGRSDSDWYAWLWTETFLRVPSGKSNPGKPDYTDPQGRKFWAREFGNGNEVVGIVYVPEGEGRVVPKTQDLFDVWDPITGLPRVTSDSENDMRRSNHTTHFWFNPNPGEDDKSGHYDVAIGRTSYLHHDGHVRCLDVDAFPERLVMSSDTGLRPVRGPLPEIVKSLQ